MNIPAAMSVVWEIARNTKKSKQFADLLLDFDTVLGLNIKNAENYIKRNDNPNIPKEIEKLLEERKKARRKELH